MPSDDRERHLPEDVVVIVPGVTGSALRDRDGNEVWGLSTGGVVRAIATLGGSVRHLELPDDVGDGPAPDGVTATGLIPSLHAIPGIWTPVRGYSELVSFLLDKRFALTLERPEEPDAPPGNLVLFAYDWRLSCRHSAACLKRRVEAALLRWRESARSRCDAKVTFVCHSMGGLVARWYLDKLGGAEIARMLVTLGTPHRGAAKTIDQLVNGVRKGPGPLKVNLTRFARSLPSSYELLPEYACIGDGAAAPRKTTEVQLPRLAPERVADGMRFHDELDAAAPATYPTIPVVGIGQPTLTAARLVDDRVELTADLDGAEHDGDGTVARLSARPKAMSERDPALRGVGEGHGSLAGHRSVTDQLDLLISAKDIVYRGVTPPADELLGLAVADLHDAGEPITVSVRAPHRRALHVVALDERGRETAWARVRYSGARDPAGRHLGAASLEPGDVGGYTIVVSAPAAARNASAASARATTLVLG